MNSQLISLLQDVRFHWTNRVQRHHRCQPDRKQQLTILLFVWPKLAEFLALVLLCGPKEESKGTGGVFGQGEGCEGTTGELCRFQYRKTRGRTRCCYEDFEARKKGCPGQ